MGKTIKIAFLLSDGVNPPNVIQYRFEASSNYREKAARNHNRILKTKKKVMPIKPNIGVGMVWPTYFRHLQLQSIFNQLA